MERTTPDQLDRVSGQIEPHQGLGVLPRLRGDLPHHVFRQVKLNKICQSSEGLGLDLAYLAVGAVDPLQVGDPHREEDVVAKDLDAVAANVEDLCGWFDPRWNGVPEKSKIIIFQAQLFGPFMYKPCYNDLN